MAFGPEYINGLQKAFNKNLPWGVSKVEGGENWVALRVAARDGEWLLFSWASGSTGCCLVDSASLAALKKGAPARTPLIEALKSRLLKGRILSVVQLNCDRVLEFQCMRYVAAGFGVRYSLVLEATEPTGNVLLLDENRRIEELARHVAPDQNRYRTLLPGHLYSPPPAFEGPLPSQLERLDLEALASVKGIGRPLTRLIESHWEERDPAQWLEVLQSLYEDEGRAWPCWRTPKGYMTRFPLLSEGSSLGEDALLAAAEGVLAPLEAGARLRVLRDLDTRIARAAKSKERHMDGLLKQRRNNADADLFRRKGDLLLAHLAEVLPRAEKIRLEEWGSGEFLDIELDPKLSASRNAERYFKKYRKAKVDPATLEAEIASLEAAIKELREQRDLLESIDDPALLEEAAKDVMDWLAPTEEARGGKGKKKEKPLPPHLRYEVEGLVVLVGLSARGNRYVTFKQAVGDDLWLHAHELPGAHVIVKGAKGREALSSEVLEFAASLAADYSKAKNAASVQIDFTERRYVRSVPGAAIALVTYVNPGTIRVEPHFWRRFLANQSALP